MDCHSLTRRQLQTLCKKYGIPANTTNVQMASCLSALLNSKPELQDEASMEINGSDATPRPAIRKTKIAELGTVSDRNMINLPSLSTPANSAGPRGENNSEVTEKDNLGDSDMPRTCIVDSLASHSRSKKGSVSFSETVEVKVMQSYDEPLVEITPIVNAKRTRASSRLSVGGTSVAATSVGKRASALKVNSCEAEPVASKHILVTRNSKRKAPLKESSDSMKTDKIQETQPMTASRRQRRSSTVTNVDDASEKLEEVVTTGRSKPPRTPRVLTIEVTSSRKNSRSSFGTLEKKQLDSEFERLGNEINLAGVSSEETPCKTSILEDEGNRRVTRGSIGRVTRSASKASIAISAQTSNIAGPTPMTNGRNGRLMSKNVATNPCLSKAFEELSVCDGPLSNSESSNITSSETKANLVGNGQLESSPTSENIINVDNGAEHVNKALHSEVSAESQAEERVENSSVHFDAVTHADHSVEGYGQEFSSEEKYPEYPDSDNVVIYEEINHSNPNEFIKQIIMSVAEDVVHNSDILKSSLTCKAGCLVSEKDENFLDCNLSATCRISNGPMIEEGNEESSVSLATIADVLTDVQSEEGCLDGVIEDSYLEINNSSEEEIVMDLAAQDEVMIHNIENVVTETEYSDISGLAIYFREGTETNPSKEISQDIESLGESEGRDSMLSMEKSKEDVQCVIVCDSLDAACSVAECNATFCLEEYEEDVKSVIACDSSDTTLSLLECNNDELVYHPNKIFQSLIATKGQDATFCQKECKEDTKSANACVTSHHADCSTDIESVLQHKCVEDVKSNNEFEEVEGIPSALEVNKRIETLKEPVSFECTGNIESSERCLCIVTMEHESSKDVQETLSAEEVNNKQMERPNDSDHLEENHLAVDVTEETGLMKESSSIGTIKQYETEVCACTVVEDNKDSFVSLIQDAVHSDEETEKSSLTPGNAELDVEDDSSDCARENPTAGIDVIVQKFANLSTTIREDMDQYTLNMSSDSKDCGDGKGQSLNEEESVSVVGEVIIEQVALEGNYSMTTQKVYTENANMSSEEPVKEQVNFIEIESCSESIPNPMKSKARKTKLQLSPKKAQLSSLSLRKLKELVKKKDRVLVSQSSADKEKSDETSIPVTPVSGVKKPWNVSTKLMNSTAAQPSDSPLSVGKRSALKSLPSNLRQASTGGGTPSGKLSAHGLSIAKVQSPGIQCGDAGGNIF